MALPRLLHDERARARVDPASASVASLTRGREALWRRPAHPLLNDAHEVREAQGSLRVVDGAVMGRSGALSL